MPEVHGETGGADDERGTVNFITPQVVQKGAACVRRGQVFSLGMHFGADGPQIGQGGRVNPLHLMSATDSGVTPEPGGFRFADDVIVMPLQCATQWDSLAHVHYDGQLYNGYPSSSISPAGAARNSCDVYQRQPFPGGDDVRIKNRDCHCTQGTQKA